MISNVTCEASISAAVPSELDSPVRTEPRSEAQETEPGDQKTEIKSQNKELFHLYESVGAGIRATA